MKKFLVWFIAILITLGASVYQRKSGPTYPLKISGIPGDEKYTAKLLRTAETGKSVMITLEESDAFDEVLLIYSKYPGDFENTTIHVKNTGGVWEAYLPDQPPAGKLKYYIVLFKDGKHIWDNKDNAAIIRFKGAVPSFILIPHIIAMFAAMLFSMVTLFIIIFNTGNYRLFMFLTIGLLIVGGFIFGPIMQNYAFGDYWTGWPVGKDFTDNKTLIGLLFWLVALVLNFKKDRKWIVVVAAISMLVVFSIPHSMGGSEFNYETGTVETGNKTK